MEPDSLSWRDHWRLIVVAAILAVFCWGGLVIWQDGQPPRSGMPQNFGPVISASPTPSVVNVVVPPSVVLGVPILATPTPIPPPQLHSRPPVPPPTYIPTPRPRPTPSSSPSPSPSVTAP